MPISARLFRASHASDASAIPSAPARTMAIGVADGVAATSNAAGSVTAATQNKSLELGTIIARLPGHGDLLEDLLNHFHDAESLDFELRPQDQPVLQNRHRHGLDIVRRHEIAA